MALNAGDPQATSGLAKAIYVALSTAVVAQGVTPTPAMQTSWQTLSFAIATGVVAELTRGPAAAPDFAQTYSSGAQDPFWAWLAGFVNVFQTTWKPTTPDGLALQSALKAFLTGSPVPVDLKGIIQ